MSNYLHNIYGRREDVEKRVADDTLLGAIGIWPDETKSDGKILSRRSGVHVVLRLVKNVSGGTLARGTLVQFKAGSEFTEIDSLAGAGEVADGIIDPLGSKATIADDAYCLIVVRGPVDSVPVASGNGPYSVGDLVKTAASGELQDASARSDAGFTGVVRNATSSAGDAADIWFEHPDSVGHGFYV